MTGARRGHCQRKTDMDDMDAATTSVASMASMAASTTTSATLLLLLVLSLQQCQGTDQDEYAPGSNVSIFPYFDFNVPRNVTTAEGQTGFLHCRVEHLGDKAVSWIRKRDLHILTAGVLTYTSDQRFTVIRPDRSENWTLQIRSSQGRDSGVYECQVNTEPKMSLSFQLNVIEWKAQILGSSDLHVKTGSSVTLTCVLSQGPHDLGTVQWFRNDVLLSNMLAGDVHPNALDPEPRLRITVAWTDALTSKLYISYAKPADSGNYTCKPTSLADSASVNVHVINGEHPAAMQHGNKNRASALSLHCLVYSVALVVMRR
ncbi:zwei Ig domain protein zig-8-like isoform X2 [Thrips palmi]|uniref:Zwei Ig domain protein zig-8-like isoform X2 n=1 Tax=Thrips palmi TaxID=161013 RepID=A0A6P8Z874_THRPL|nr:zwei Ig domain protein zig-8-like isoform X2 [Thrips palmi]